MSSLALKVHRHQEEWSLDLSDKNSASLVLQLLRDQGIVVLKGATDAIPKWPQINENKFINALIGSARDGGFRVSYVKEHDFPRYAPLTIGRSPDWKQLANDDDIIAIGCYHLGGDTDQRWIVQYDPALRKEETNKMSIIEACGGDIVICNGWLRRSSPTPTVREGKAMVIHYMWNGNKPT